MPSITFLKGRPGENRLLALELRKYDFVCSLIEPSEEVIDQLREAKPDLFMIEFDALPDAEVVCSYLRKELQIPVLALTEPEVVLSLNGAIDDFARIGSTTDEIAVRAKRILAKKKPAAHTHKIEAGNLVIDTDKYEVFIDERLINLTFKEYELLRFLASNPGRVFTRDVLLNRVWGDDYFGGDRTVDVHIRRLRGKIEDQYNSFIDTVRNIGYRFKTDTEA